MPQSPFPCAFDVPAASSFWRATPVSTVMVSFVGSFAFFGAGPGKAASESRSKARKSRAEVKSRAVA